MSHRIDAEHEQEVTQGAVVSLRPGKATSAPRANPASRPDAMPQASREPQVVTRAPIWDKNNFGFWLTVCIIISVVFSILYRALS